MLICVDYKRLKSLCPFLDCGNYYIELETNNTKKRAGIYMKKNIKCKRRKDLEQESTHVDVSITKTIS